MSFPPFNHLPDGLSRSGRLSLAAVHARGNCGSDEFALTSGTEGASCRIFASGTLGVEDSGGQSGELVDLISTEMGEEPPLERSDVVVLGLLELLDSLPSNRNVDTPTVVAGGRPGDQSPRLEFGDEP